MSWNYRIVKTIDDSGDVYLGIHEVYYEKDNKTPYARSVDAIAVWGSDIGDLKTVLRQMKRALASKILTDEDFPSHE